MEGSMAMERGAWFGDPSVERSRLSFWWYSGFMAYGLPPN